MTVTENIKSRTGNREYPESAKPPEGISYILEIISIFNII
jgi:hypothetical protein